MPGPLIIEELFMEVLVKFLESSEDLLLGESLLLMKPFLPKRFLWSLVTIMVSLEIILQAKSENLGF